MKSKSNPASSPPYEYAVAITTYLASREAAYGLTQTITRSSSRGDYEEAPPTDRAALRKGLDALRQLVSCDADAEGGAVLPPLVAAVATRDQAIVESEATKFVAKTLESYDGSLFLMVEGAMACPTPASSALVDGALYDLKNNAISSVGLTSADRLSLLTYSFLRMFTGDQPLWLAYADSCVPESDWEGVSGLQNLARRLRLTVLEVKDLAPKGLASEVYNSVAGFMLPDESKGASWFGNYFCTAKSRLNEFKKELEAEAEVLGGAAPAISTANNILSAPLPGLTPSLSEFYRALEKTCSNLQSILSDSDMSSPHSNLSKVLSGGFQSGCGPPSLAKALARATNGRKAVEKKVGLEMTWLPLYQRYTSECPTIDRVWLDYARMLLEAGVDCKKVVNVAVKNVPWSGALHSLRVSLEAGAVIDEGSRENILKSLKKMLNRSLTNFFLGYHEKVDAWIGFCSVVSRWLVSAKSGAGAEEEGDSEDGDVDDLQDDLVTDLREAFDEAEQWCWKNRPGKRYKESKVLKARALAEALVICDDESEGEGEGGGDGDDGDGEEGDRGIQGRCEAERCFEKLVKADGTSGDNWEAYLGWATNKYKVGGFIGISRLYRRAFNGVVGESMRGAKYEGLLKE